MVRSMFVVALAAASAALTTSQEINNEPLFTIELGPGVTQQVTEAEKLALKFVSNTYINRNLDLDY